MNKINWRKSSILIAALAIVLITTYVIAAPPGSKYTPGETLDPTCAPGDANCSVDINANDSYLNLSDTPNSFVREAIPYTNSIGNALTHSSLFRFKEFQSNQQNDDPYLYINNTSQNNVELRYGLLNSGQDTYCYGSYIEHVDADSRKYIATYNSNDNTYRYGGGSPEDSVCDYSTRGISIKGSRVGIGTDTPNSTLHVKTDPNWFPVEEAKIDIQSNNSSLWSIYQNDATDELRFWNNSFGDILALGTTQAGVQINSGSLFLHGDDTGFSIGQDGDNFSDPEYFKLSGADSLFHSKVNNNIFNGNVSIGTTNSSSKLQVVGLQEYTDNAAAITAGLTIGAFYRTGDVVKIVH